MLFLRFCYLQRLVGLLYACCLCGSCGSGPAASEQVKQYCSSQTGACGTVFRTRSVAETMPPV